MKEGDILGERFLITRTIEGGMGVVYFAVDLTEKQQGPLALKTIRADIADRDSMRRFEDEARLWVHLQAGDFMVSLLEIFKLGEKVYLVMPQLQGGTLRDRLRCEVSDYRDSVLWMTQVLIALYRLDEYESLVHRDIKPENILFDGSGDAHITDLGIAKDVRDRARIAQPRDATDPSQAGTQGFLGTVLYAAPEQFRGGTVDKRADIWAFGAVFFELMTGRPPFFAESTHELVDKICTQPLPDGWAALGNTAPAGVADVIARCLAKLPTARFQSFEELVNAWDKLILIPDQAAYDVAVGQRVVISHPQVSVAWDYFFKARKNSYWITFSQGRYAALKRAAEFRQLNANVEAIDCAAAALSEPGNQLYLVETLFDGCYEKHAGSIDDQAKRLSYPHPFIMVMIWHEWWVAQVARISDGAQLGDEERNSLNRFARRLLENDLGLADLRNAAAQVTFLLGDLELSRSLIKKVMASRNDPRDWHVYLKLEAGIRTLEDLRPIVIDIVGHFAKVKRYHAQRVCALACTRIGKWDFAAQFWEAAYDLSPNDHRILEESQACFARAGWDDEAERIGTRIIRHIQRNK